MMVKPTLKDLTSKSGSKFALVIATASRARQILEGAPVLTKVKEESAVTLAANEIMEGAVKIVC